jgi:hypothetical protein
MLGHFLALIYFYLVGEIEIMKEEGRRKKEEGAF